MVLLTVYRITGYRVLVEYDMERSDVVIPEGDVELVACEPYGMSWFSSSVRSADVVMDEMRRGLPERTQVFGCRKLYDDSKLCDYYIVVWPPDGASVCPESCRRDRVKRLNTRELEKRMSLGTEDVSEVRFEYPEKDECSARFAEGFLRDQMQQTLKKHTGCWYTWFGELRFVFFPDGESPLTEMMEVCLSSGVGLCPTRTVRKRKSVLVA